MKYFRWFLVTLLIAFIFYNSSLDGVDSSGMSNPIAIFVARLLPWSLSVDEIEYIIRKLAHFSEYALLGTLVFWAHHKTPLFNKNKLVPLFFFLVPVIDENIQRFSVGRSCEIKDMLIDSSGYIFGLFLGILVLSFYKGGIHNDKMES